MTLALELLGQATIAVRRPLPGHLDQGVQERPVLARPGLVVRAAARHAQHLAELIDRKLFTQQQHHLSFLVESEASLLEAFFRISFSRVMRPRTCSSSAIRACSAERAASLSKTRCAAPGRRSSTTPAGSAPSAVLAARLRLGLDARQDVEHHLRLELRGELTSLRHVDAPSDWTHPSIMHLSSFRAHYTRGPYGTAAAPRASEVGSGGRPWTRREPAGPRATGTRKRVRIGWGAGRSLGSWSRTVTGTGSRGVALRALRRSAGGTRVRSTGSGGGAGRGRGECPAWRPGRVGSVGGRPLGDEEQLVTNPRFGTASIGLEPCHRGTHSSRGRA